VSVEPVAPVPFSLLSLPSPPRGAPPGKDDQSQCKSVASPAPPVSKLPSLPSLPTPASLLSPTSPASPASPSSPSKISKISKPIIPLRTTKPAIPPFRPADYGVNRVLTQPVKLNRPILPLAGEVSRSTSPALPARMDNPILAKIIRAHSANEQRLDVSLTYEKDRQIKRLANFQKNWKNWIINKAVFRTRDKPTLPTTPPPDSLLIQAVSAKKLPPLGSIVGSTVRPCFPPPLPAVELEPKEHLRNPLPPQRFDLPESEVEPKEHNRVSATPSPPVVSTVTPLVWDSYVHKTKDGKGGKSVTKGQAIANDPKNLSAKARFGALIGAFFCLVVSFIVISVLPGSKTKPHASVVMVIGDYMIAIGCSVLIWEVISLLVIRCCRNQTRPLQNVQDERQFRSRRASSVSISHTRTRSMSKNCVMLSPNKKILDDKDGFLKVL